MSQQYHTQQPAPTPSPRFAEHITAEPDAASISSLPFPRSSSEESHSPRSPNSLHSPDSFPYPQHGCCSSHNHSNGRSPVDSSSDTQVDFAEKGQKSLIHHAQEYKLPLTVKAIAESYIQIANTMALITALLATVQVSMAQIVLSNGSNPASAGWLTLHWLVYAGIFLNSGATASALAFINYAGYLTASARALLLTEPDSWPCRVLYGEELPSEFLSLPYIDEDFELMFRFGLKRNMRPVWHALSYGFYAGSGFFFASLCLWIWLIEPFAVAASLTVLIVPPAAWLTSSFFFTAEHIPSVPKDLSRNLAFCACTALKLDWNPKPINMCGRQFALY